MRLAILTLVAFVSHHGFTFALDNSSLPSCGVSAYGSYCLSECFAIPLRSIHMDDQKPTWVILDETTLRATVAASIKMSAAAQVLTFGTMVPLGLSAMQEGLQFFVNLARNFKFVFMF